MTYKDYAASDPRSVAAMIRGDGDGRERAWGIFKEIVGESHPVLDDADLTTLYRQVVHKHGDTDVVPGLAQRVLRFFGVGGGAKLEKKKN